MSRYTVGHRPLSECNICCSKTSRPGRLRLFKGVTGRRDHSDRGECEEVKRKWVRVIRVKVKERYDEMR